MSSEIHSKVPAWFWLLAILAVLWNLVGVASYLMDVTLSEEALAQLPEAQRNLRAATPSWVTGCYAIAAFAGALGSIALLVRKAWAKLLFAVSLAAVILQMGYVFIGMNASEVLGAAAMIFPAIIIVLGIFWLWFSMLSQKRGWLG
jgi:hypothetical protein